MIDFPDGVDPRCRLDTEAATQYAHDLYHLAREIGGEEHLEWTFSVNAFRGLARRNPVLNHYYEPLATWEETVRALQVKELLTRNGIEDRYGVGVVLGLEIYDTTLTSTTGRLLTPTAEETFRGRHSVAADSVYEEEMIVFANSWGADWGDQGLGYITRDYFEAHVDSVYCLRPLFMGASPAMEDRLNAILWQVGKPGGVADAAEYAKAWREPNPRLLGTVTIRGVEYERWRRRVVSFKDGWPAVDVYEIVDNQALVGRFHLLHRSGESVADMEEIWVPPGARRRGHGAALEIEAAGLARARGAMTVRLPLFEADAGESNTRAAIDFARSRGYHWRTAPHRRPNIVGVAERSVVGATP